jgi:hypothetical protein
MARKHYTEEEVGRALAVLRSNSGNLKKTAALTGVTRATLRAWAAGDLRQHNPEAVHDKETVIEAMLADGFHQFALKAVAKANTQEFVDSLKGRDLLLSAAIATDKGQLLRGKPTARNDGLKVSLVMPNGLKALAVQVVQGEQTTELRAVDLTDSQKDSPRAIPEIIRENEDRSPYGDSRTP